MSLTGIGSGPGSPSPVCGLAQRGPGVRQGWLNCQRLVIDEISMVEADLFDKLEAWRVSMYSEDRVLVVFRVEPNNPSP